MVDTLDMTEKWKMAVDTAMESGRSEDEAEAYLFAVGALRDALSGLKAAGIKPNECCDALGHTLLDQLTDHCSEEQAFLWAEEFLAMLKWRYDAAKSTTPGSPP